MSSADRNRRTQSSVSQCSSALGAVSSSTRRPSRGSSSFTRPRWPTTTPSPTPSSSGNCSVTRTTPPTAFSMLPGAAARRARSDTTSSDAKSRSGATTHAQLGDRFRSRELPQLRRRELRQLRGTQWTRMKKGRSPARRCTPSFRRCDPALQQPARPGAQDRRGTALRAGAEQLPCEPAILAPEGAAVGLNHR